MSSRAFTDEEKEKYEIELIEFIDQRIKQACGSLPFQHLVSTLPQLSFEIRDALVSTKSHLMKFLKSHSKNFNVDSKGIVTVVHTPILENDYNDYRKECSTVKKSSSLPSTISNGYGRITKIHNEFGFINAIEPIRTTVYFRGPQFGGGKDSVLSALDINSGWNVHFNAVLGHTDSDAKYRATKVWRDTEDEPDDKYLSFSLKNKDGDDCSSSKYINEDRETEEDNLDGEGVVQKLLPQLGFISIDGRQKESVFFHKRTLTGYENVDDLKKVLKTGDRVKFNAVKSFKADSQAKWQAVAVWKKSKKSKQKNVDFCSDVEQSDDAEHGLSSNSKYRKHKKETMKNVPGKISVHANGINILFGEKFTEIADGSKGVYFLYGSQVTDIDWEFSDGDDVLFDAVRIKAEPGWKAVLVWSGIKPDNVIYTDESDEFLDDKNFSEAEVPSSKRATNFKSKNYNTEESKKKYHDHSGHSVGKIKKEFDRNQRNCNLGSSRSSSVTSLSSRESSQLNKERKQSEYKNCAIKHNREKNKRSPNKKTSNSVRGSHHTSFSKDILSRDNTSANKRYILNDSQDDTEFQITSKFSSRNKQHNRRSLKDSERKSIRSFHELEEDEDFKHDEIMLKCKKRSFNQSHIESFDTYLESEDEKKSSHDEVTSESIKRPYGKASIKKHRGIDGIVTKVHYKVAHCENIVLQKPISFLSHSFYYNGVPAEELQLEDLRERISKGDTVKLNCFEIVDDVGKLYQTVTLAYIGEEPKISEKTVEDFINEHELSVTIDDECNMGDDMPVKDTPKKFLSAISDSNSEEELEVSSKSSSCEESKISEKTVEDFINEHELSVTINDKCNMKDDMLAKDTPKKFLSTVSDSNSEEELDVSSSSSCDALSLSSKYSNLQNSHEQNVMEPSEVKEMRSSIDYNLLSEMISQKLLPILKSEVDLNALSAEIVDLVSKHHVSGTLDHLQGNAYLNDENEAAKNPVCSRCAGKFNEISSKTSKARHKEVQTIVTGDIVAQSIFTEL